MKEPLKKLVMVLVAALTFGAMGGEVTATAMTAQQRYPWNGLVDITVTLSGTSNDAAQVACTFVATNSATHAALNVFHVIGSSVVSGSGSTWTRQFVWDAAADLGEVKIADVELAVEAKPLGGVQLWENGSYWAECNVGATKPEECGCYFWWGDTVGYSANTNSATWTVGTRFDYWNGVKWVSSKGAEMNTSPFSWLLCPSLDNTEEDLRLAGYIDSTGNLVAAHDAATAHLGAPWRMPTDADFADLTNKCDSTWETCNGVWGRRVTGKDAYASKSIFLPAAGYGDDSDLCETGSYGSYWSSTPYFSSRTPARRRSSGCLNFDSNDFMRSDDYRYSGGSVRPLRGFATFGLAFSAATTHMALDTRTGARYAQAEEPIAFDTAWSVGVTQLVLIVDGVNVLTTTSPTNGVYVWNPDLSTARAVTLELATYGTANETLTATFGATGGEVTATAVTAQQRYPWNGLVDITVTLTGASNDVAQAVCTFGATNSATHASLNVFHVTSGNMVPVTDGTWTRQFVWDATADIGEMKIADVSLAVECFAPMEPTLGGVQLWEDGPYWAECNVGATKPEEYGYYFRWGDTVGYKQSAGTWADGSCYVTWVSSKGDMTISGPFSSSTCSTYDKTTEQLQSAGYIDSTGLLVASHDVATAHLGAPWRMPTYADIVDLDNKCDTTWETCNGVWGLRVTGKDAYASRSIFLPAAGGVEDSAPYYAGSEGYCWTSEPHSEDPTCARCLFFDSDGNLSNFSNYRYDGISVRPVRGFTTPSISFGTAATHLTLDTRTGARYVQAEEPIVFNTAWSEGVTRLVLTVDGVNVLTTTSPTNGVYVWKPDLSTPQTVTLRHTTYGTVNEALAVTFRVAGGGDPATGGEDLATGGEVTAMAVTAQQRYPWNGLVDIAVTFSGTSNDVAQVACTFVATNSATHAALDVSHVTGGSVVSGSGSTWTRQFVWDAAADLGKVKIADVSLTVAVTEFLGGVQLWKNGPYWAECNVGASKPEEYGYYFWWGDTIGYSANTNSATWTDDGNTEGDDYYELHYWDGVTWVSSDGTEMSSSPFRESACPTYGKDISQLQSADYVDSEGNLVAAHDAATAHLGAPWRMPTDAEFSALTGNGRTRKCTTTWEICNGVWGLRVTGKGAYASKSIFLPAAGCGDGSELYNVGTYDVLWSSTPDLEDSTYACGSYFDSDGFFEAIDYRYCGNSVRPVRGCATLGQVFGLAATHLALDTRTETRCVRAEEPIVFSTDWSEGVTQLVLTVDGVDVLTTTSATNGIYLWKPDLSMTRIATLKLTICGTENEALTATFGATGGEVTMTSVTAQQRYPWNGLVDITVTLSGTSNDAAQAVCTFVATNSATHTAMDVSHVTGGSVVSGSGNTWTRRFVWDAATDIGELKIADVSLTVAATEFLGGVQLWENGPYWAECNVGATKPEEYGYYFWWGDTVGYSANTNNATWTDEDYIDGDDYYELHYWEGVKWVSSDGTEMSSCPFNESSCPTYGKDVSQLQSAGYVDSEGNLVAAHDAATAHLGAPWRMPTDAEFSALTGNGRTRKCTTNWETCNGVWGMRVTGKGAYASKSIFIPAAGYGYDPDLGGEGLDGCYWSSTPDPADPTSARGLYFNSDGFMRLSEWRCDGISVRPVREFDTVGVALGSATTHLVLDTLTETRGVRAEEPIVFSTDWSEGVTQLVVTVDGVNVLTTTSPTNGVYVWKPDLSTTRTVTLEHTTYGTENETLTATFITAAYDVTFVAGAHGVLAVGVPATQRVLHGEAAVPPEVVPAAGYRFTGWSADTSNVVEDIKVTALYEAISYTITYEDLHGATHANPSTYTIEDDVTFTAPSAIPRRQFVRWEPASIAAGSTGEVTVKAVWEKLPLYVDAAKGNDAWEGSSAGQAVRTLAKAYALAEAGDVILVAAGTYAPVTATGKAVTFRGADGATIDGNDEERCVTADDDVVFENFILQNGYDYFKGGGVCGGTFERCTIRNCYSGNSGGGAYDAILRHCVIVGNMASYSGGGAIGGTLVGCVIVGNIAKYGCGGGVYRGTLVGCVVKDNVAGEVGGGVYEPESMSDTTFSGNSPEDTPDVGGTMKAGGTHLHVPSGSETIYVIPHDWFLATGLAKAGDSAAGLDAKLADVYANGYTGWESYVAGLSPNDPTSQFRAVITITDGKVGVSWTPDLNSNGVTRIYTVFGRTDLATGDWRTPVRPWHQFFKVEVAMPTGAWDEKSAAAGGGFVPEGGVQLWENGPYWAECNVGATKPEECGYYFWWGDTVGYSVNTNSATWVDGTTDDYWWDDYWRPVTWVSSKGEVMSYGNPFGQSSICPTYGMTEAMLQSAGYIDSTGNLVAAHDAATAHRGAPWRMPTDADFDDLISKCDTTWTTCNGVWGRRVTGRGAYSSKSIFLPAAGRGYFSDLYVLGSSGKYWSSAPSWADDYICMSWIIDFSSGYFRRVYCNRYYGLSVRPVRDVAK